MSRKQITDEPLVREDLFVSTETLRNVYLRMSRVIIRPSFFFFFFFFFLVICMSNDIIFWMELRYQKNKIL